MKKIKTISTRHLHPLARRDKKRRWRGQRRGTFFLLFLVSALAAWGAWSLATQGLQPFSIVESGIWFPAGFLILVMAAALYIKRAAGTTTYSLCGQRLERCPSFWARTLKKTPYRKLELGADTSLRLVESPWGNGVLVENPNESPIQIPLDLQGDELYHRLQDLYPPPEAAERLKVALKREGDDEQLMEALGTWALLSEKGWSELEDLPGPPDVPTLRRLWRRERRLLDYGALLDLMDILLESLNEDALFLSDALRLAMALRIRSLTEDALSSLERPALNCQLPLTRWRKNLQGPPPVKAALPVVAARRYRLDLEHRTLRMGIDEGLALDDLVALLRRRGFTGTRSILIYDIWGQRHEIPPSSTDDALDDLATALLTAAPHILEIHEERSWSLGSRSRRRWLKRQLSR